MIQSNERKNINMTEKISSTCRSESLPDSGTLELEQMEEHLQMADNLRALISDSTNDPDKAIADLIIDTNIASDATAEDMIIADEVGFGQLLEVTQGHDDTAYALARQASEPLGVALRELNAVQGDAALQIILDQIGTIQDEHARRDDRPRTIEQSHREHEAVLHAHVADGSALRVRGQVEYIEDHASANHLHASEEMNRTSQARELLGIPVDFKHFQLVDSSEQAQRDDDETMARAMRNEFAEGRKLWQERTFGSSEIDPLIIDVTECFAREVGERVGQELIDETTGETKRPIMDISLDAHSAEQIARTITERSVSLTHTLAVLTELAETGVQKSRNECATLLVDMGVWSRDHGRLLEGDCPAGTIADLYIDSKDLEQYAQIDALVAQLTGKAVDSQARIAEGVVNLAAYTFPSGVELMHATHADSLSHIAERGAIAPRSQVLHGVNRATQLNGGFVHMTAPGSAAYEYARGAQKVVLGVPIDVIMDNSPYIHLEHAYMDNKFSRPNETTGYVDQHSMQYELGRLQVNDMKTAPVVFRAALETMHTNLDKGLRQAFLKNGLYNNFSFAASDRADTASAYTYPLENISIYTNSFEPISKAIERHPETRDTLYNVAHVAVAGREHQVIDYKGGMSSGGGRVISEIALPNFDIDNKAGITVFAPIASREVNFTEGDVGNSFNESGLNVSLDTVKPDRIAKFSGDLLENGVAPEVVLEESLKSINEQGGRAWELIGSYNQHRAAFDRAGISIEKIIQRLSPEKLGEINLATFNPQADESSSTFMNQDDYASLTKAYGDRLYFQSPDSFAIEARLLEASGYLMNEQQQAYVAAYQEQERELEKKPIELPDFDLHF